ncbi:MAG TPA: hypothetical protein VNV25_25295 [Gemmatimonadaceae bacterium]|nr:hypothetical protein [Gemmatimonadaceae bacterium]
MTDTRTDAEVAKSAEAYGLPTTYRAAVEEVHEWREASQVDGYFTPASLRKYLVSQGQHHDEHHAREKRLQGLALKALKRRKKAETDGAASIAYDFAAAGYLDEILTALLVDQEGVCFACEDAPTGADGRASFCPLHR